MMSSQDLTNLIHCLPLLNSRALGTPKIFKIIKLRQQIINEIQFNKQYAILAIFGLIRMLMTNHHDKKISFLS